MTLAIDGLDAATLEGLEAESRRRGVDVAAVARDILQNALRTAPARNTTISTTWRNLVGADAEEFLSATADLRRIDPELWK